MALRPSDHPRLRRRIQRRFRNVRRWFYGKTGQALCWLLPRTPRPLLRLASWSLVVPIANLMLRQRAEENLVRVYGDKLSPAARKQILRGVIRNVGNLFVETPRLVRRGHKMLEDVDTAEAEKRFQQLVQDGMKGWIAIGGHIGNWELLAAWTSKVVGDRQCHAIGKRLPNPHLNALLEAARRSIDVETIYRDDPPTRQLRALRQGDLVGILPDQDMPTVAGTFIDFLGLSAYTPLGPARLALAAKVPIVPLACVRVGNGFKIIVRDPIVPDSSRPKHEEIQRLTQAWSKELESLIHEYPDQWAWFHRRWKTTPEMLADRSVSRAENPRFSPG